MAATIGERDPSKMARSFDLFDLPAGYFDDPYPYPWLRLLRNHDAIHQNSDGSVLLTRYHDIRGLWRDRTALVDKTARFTTRFGGGPLLEHHTSSMLFRDPPDHDRLRAVVNPFFSPASLERFREFIENLVDELLENAAQRGEFDLVSDFAAQIPISLITRILGVPPDDGPALRDLGLKVLYPLNPSVAPDAIAAGHAATAQFCDYIARHLRAVRARGVHGQPNTVLEAVAAGCAGGAMTEQECLHMCLLVFNGGHETTTNLIAVGAQALLSHPEQYRLLAQLGPDDIPAAIEEIIRYVTPLQLQGRRTVRDLSLPSGPLAAGTEVVLAQTSANRDERAFDEPDTLDLWRKPNAHVSFGLGVHACLGHHLARLEGRIVLPRLARRFPTLSPSGRAIFSRNVRFRGLRSLPVQIGARP